MSCCFATAFPPHSFSTYPSAPRIATMSSAFARFINSETGPKTVHFWAPVLKWSLVFAGANDLQKPVEVISGTQQIALFCTGVIWTRWSFVIRPKNYMLASVNFFLGGVAGYQLYRLFDWRTSVFKESPMQAFSYILKGDPKKQEPKKLEA